MNLPHIQEICPGETNDFLLELVRKERNNIPPGCFCRRAELCDAILSINKEVGNRARMKSTLITTLRQWCARKDQIAQLESMGFRLTKGRTHYKIRINNSAYFLAVGSTPSDHRSGSNAVYNAQAVFF